MKGYRPFWAGSLLIGLAISISLFLSSPSFAQATLNGIVSRNANLRSGPGTTYVVVGYVKAGQSVSIIDKNDAGDWYKLSTGEWIASFLVEVGSANVSALATQADTKANHNANLRSGPSPDYKIIGYAQEGQDLNIVARNEAGDWFMLSDGKWIAAYLVDNAPVALRIENTSTIPPLAQSQSTQGQSRLMLIAKSVTSPLQILFNMYSKLCINGPNQVINPTKGCIMPPMITTLLFAVVLLGLGWLIKILLTKIGIDIAAPLRFAFLWLFIWGIFGPAGLAVGVIGSPFVYFILLFIQLRDRFSSKEYPSTYQTASFVTAGQPSGYTSSESNDSDSRSERSSYDDNDLYYYPDKEEKKLFREVYGREPNSRDIRDGSCMGIKEKHRSSFPDEWEESSSDWSWGKTYTHKDNDDDGQESSKSPWSW